MATEYKRINLLIGNAASLGSISEEGTPAIWSDTGDAVLSSVGVHYQADPGQP